MKRRACKEQNIEMTFRQTYRERSTGAVPDSMCLNLSEGEMDTKKRVAKMAYQDPETRSSNG